MDEAAALDAYAPLLRSALGNAEALGITAALTGPYLRGRHRGPSDCMSMPSIGFAPTPAHSTSPLPIARSTWRWRVVSWTWSAPARSGAEVRTATRSLLAADDVGEH